MTEESNRAPVKSMNVLVVHETLPHADRHGADVQWMQMLKELRAQGHRVTHIARSDVNRDRYQAEVEALGIRVLTPDAQRMRCQGREFPESWRLDELMRGEHFDLAILFHWFWNGISVPEDYMEDIRRLSPKTFIAVLTDDQQGLRELQMAQLTQYWPDFERSEDYTSREMEVYRRADVVLTISDDDARAFRKAAPEIATGRMPMIAEVDASEDLPGFASRADLMFLANFDNLANRDAVTWLIAEIWPLIRHSLPDAQLRLVGNNLPDEPLYRQPGVVRVGFAADLGPEFARCRVVVSPIRFGTGIKTKNLLALSHAVPLVTTTVGADGMNLKHGETALIADDVRSIADAVVQAYTGESTWKRLSVQGRAHIGDEFSAARMTEAVRALMEQARSVSPKNYQPAFRWSFRRVEEKSPDCVTGQPPQQRPSLRVAAYVSCAEEFLDAGQPFEALAQLRHLYGLLRGRVRATSLTIRSLELTARSYREMGNESKAAEYDERVRQCCSAKPAVNRADAGSRGRKKKRGPVNPEKAAASRPEITFSVVLPTYNRRDTLAQCLEALGRQTLSAGEFEVIVVDDGSKDGTAEFFRAYRAPFSFRYMRQANAGAGAARRYGVQQARGKFLVLINDDTIAAPDLLAVHLRTHQQFPDARHLVLGDFRFPLGTSQRALTRFLCESAFFFPQVSLRAGVHWDYSKVVTCNLSVRRDALLDAGSFDPEFRVAEDSELGLRLSRKGYFVRYVPEAVAVHQHLEFTADDLVQRAKVYGAMQLRFLRKHPGLLGDGTTQYGWLDSTIVEKWRAATRLQQNEIRGAEEALAKFDHVDFGEFERATENRAPIGEEVMRLFRRAVPEVYWHHYYSSLLRAWDNELFHPTSSAMQRQKAETDVFL